MNGYGNSALTHDFFAYNTSNQVWNGSSFVSWSDGSYTSYRITATQIGTSGQFTGSLPAGATRYELRERGSTLATSYVVWAVSVGPSAADVVSAINADATQTTARNNAATAATQATAAATEVVKIPRASVALTAGANYRKTKAAATSSTLDETIGATPS